MFGATGAIAVTSFFSVAAAPQGHGPFSRRSPADTARHGYGEAEISRAFSEQFINGVIQGAVILPRLNCQITVANYQANAGWNVYLLQRDEYRTQGF
jgi:hypothetical protein